MTFEDYSQSEITLSSVQSSIESIQHYLFEGKKIERVLQGVEQNASERYKAIPAIAKMSLSVRPNDSRGFAPYGKDYIEHRYFSEESYDLFTGQAIFIGSKDNLDPQYNPFGLEIFRNAIAERIGINMRVLADPIFGNKELLNSLLSEANRLMVDLQGSLAASVLYSLRDVNGNFVYDDDFLVDKTIEEIYEIFKKEFLFNPNIDRGSWGRFVSDEINKILDEKGDISPSETDFSMPIQDINVDENQEETIEDIWAALHEEPKPFIEQLRKTEYVQDIAEATKLGDELTDEQYGEVLRAMSKEPETFADFLKVNYPGLLADNSFSGNNSTQYIEMEIRNSPSPNFLGSMVGVIVGKLKKRK